MGNVICVFIINKENDVLLGTRKTKSYIGQLQTPGGSIEIDETPSNAAIRETQEETGLKIEILGFLGSIIITRDDHYHKMFHVLAVVKDTNVKIPTDEQPKCDDWKWYPLNSINLELCTPATQDGLRKLRTLFEEKS